jgi:hypothetical protein
MAHPLQLYPFTRKEGHFNVLSQERMCGPFLLDRAAQTAVDV